MGDTRNFPPVQKERNQDTLLWFIAVGGEDEEGAGPRREREMVSLFPLSAPEQVQIYAGPHIKSLELSKLARERGGTCY